MYFLLKKGSFRVKIVDFFRAKYPPRKWLSVSVLRVYGLLYLYRMVRMRLNLPLISPPEDAFGGWGGVLNLKFVELRNFVNFV